MTPNFLIAGGVASGTSFLSATLTNHPDIYLPRIQRPEPNFFHYSSKFENGMQWYLRTWFSEVKGQKAVGERSSLLLQSKLAPERIKKQLPNIKLIFCLRNPAERSWGNYRFTVLEGLEDLPFEDAIRQEEERISMATGQWAEVQPHAYVTRSRYSDCLRTYFDLFGKENILLIKSEELGKDPNANIKKVCDFLDVDSSVALKLPPNYSSPSVEDRSLQVELRNYFGKRFPEIIEAIRREEDLLSFAISDEDETNLIKLRSNLRSGKDSLTSEHRAILTELLHTELQQLKQLVDFSIEDWLD